MVQFAATHEQRRSLRHKLQLPLHPRILFYRAGLVAGFFVMGRVGRWWLMEGQSIDSGQTVPEFMPIAKAQSGKIIFAFGGHRNLDLIWSGELFKDDDEDPR